MDLRGIIAAELDRQGMTRTKLAQRAKMTAANLSDFLNGKSRVNDETLGRMFAVLKIVAKPTAKGGRPKAGRAKGRWTHGNPHA